MELDPSFEEKIPDQNSSFSLSPSHCTTFFYQNHCNPFKEHHLKGSKHHSSSSMAIPSSIGTMTMIPTPFYKATHNNGSESESKSAQNPMMLAPNNNKIEAMHGHLNTSKGVWDSSKINLFQYGETVQPQLGPSLPPSLVFDAHPSPSDKPEHLGDLSSNDGIEPQENTQGLVLSGRKRRKRSQNDSKIKGQWTANENSNLVKLVDIFGLNWSEIAKYMNGRDGKQCRERWNNHLQPQIKKGPWSEEEEKILIEAHKRVGNKWTEIARMLPGRTENAIKNRWNTAIRSQTRDNKSNRWSSSKERVLQKYINEITSNEGVEKEHDENLATQEDEQSGGNADMIFKGDDGMLGGSSSMIDYEFENGMEFLVEDPYERANGFHGDDM